MDAALPPVRDAAELFQRSFQALPTARVRAPGRLELLGNHTDYNEGLVMALAVDRHVEIAGATRNDGRVEVVTSAFEGRERFAVDRIQPNPAAPWADYVKGVLLKLRERGVRLGGASLAIHSTLPVGAGMSSSAALEVATALMIRRLWPYKAVAPERFTTLAEFDARPLSRLEKLALARTCQAAECEFVGVQVGLLDQISSLFGKAGHVIQIDCQHLSVQHDPMAAGVAVIVCDSGVKHALVGGEYNQLRAHCEAAARALGVRALRSVTPAQLEANKHLLGEREYRSARHIVGENQRVVHGERALRTGDVEQFGQFMLQSHESSRDDFGNSCAELDTLVELARALPGCLGARLTGGGFGGATINLVRVDDVRSFSSAMKLGYLARTGRSMEPMVCRIADGAG